MTEPADDDERAAWKTRMNLVELTLKKQGAIKFSQQNPHGLGMPQDSGGWIRLTTLAAACMPAVGFACAAGETGIAEILSLVCYCKTPTVQVSVEVAWYKYGRFDTASTSVVWHD